MDGRADLMEMGSEVEERREICSRLSTGKRLALRGSADELCDNATSCWTEQGFNGVPHMCALPPTGRPLRSLILPLL